MVSDGNVRWRKICPTQYAYGILKGHIGFVWKPAHVSEPGGIGKGRRPTQVLTKKGYVVTCNALKCHMGFALYAHALQQCDNRGFATKAELVGK